MCGGGALSFFLHVENVLAQRFNPLKTLLMTGILYYTALFN